jgi:hypothetical protein
VTQNSDHLSKVDVGAAWRSIVLSTMALAFAATMALAASATHAHATTREISTSSYRFADSLLPNTGLERLQTPWLPSDLYRFEGSSFSTDLLAETATTPEASTWVMMLIGFAGLGMAG